MLLQIHFGTLSSLSPRRHAHVNHIDIDRIVEAKVVNHQVQGKVLRMQSRSSQSTKTRMYYDDRRRMDNLRARSCRTRNTMETVQGSYSNHETHSSQTLSETIKSTRNHAGTPDGFTIQSRPFRISRHSGLPPLLEKKKKYED